MQPKPLTALIASLFISSFWLPLPAQQSTPRKPSENYPAFPLRVSQNHRYLVDQAGAPFLIVGDSPQGLMGRLTEADAEFYFANREKYGFNTLGWINVICAGRDYPTNHLATTPDGIRPFSGFLQGKADFEHYDLSRPNEAYFVRLDHILQLALKHHLAVFLDPMETIGWLPTLRNNGREAAFQYGQFLGRRYHDYKNVLWLSGNDFETWKAGQDGALSRAARDGLRAAYHTWRQSDDDALVHAVAKGIRAASPDQLQTLELQPNTSSSLDDPAWTSFLDLNATYTYSPTYLQMWHSYDQKPVMPTFLVESHYEFEDIGSPSDPGSPLVLRKQAYWTILSGGAGQFYGNHYTWSFEDGWRSKIDTAGAKQIGYWKHFFSSIAWQDLTPDRSGVVLVSGASSPGNLQTAVSQSDYAVAAKNADGSTIVAYLPTVRSITLNASVLNQPATAKWFDPACGTYRSVGREPIKNSGNVQFTPPEKNCSGDGDWILLLSTTKKGTAKP